MKSSCLAVLFIATLLGASCGNSKQDSRLVIGFIPSDEASRQSRQMESVARYLTEKTGRTTVLFRATDYTAVIEGLRAGKVDIAYLGPFSYLMAAGKNLAEPLVVPAHPDGAPYSYHSAIITGSGSGISSLEELCAQSGKHTFAFTDPASTSGHLVPRYFLQQRNIVPENYFKDLLFASTQPATILTVASGKADAGACSFRVLNRLLEEGVVGKDQLKLLWKSDPMTVDLVCVRKGLPADVKKQLLSAYLNMKNESPEAWENVQQEWYSEGLIYTAANDSMYNSLRRLVKNLSSF